MKAHTPAARVKHQVSTTNIIGHVSIKAPDLMNSAIIYGSDKGAIHGKTVQQKPSKVRFMVIIIPSNLQERLQDATLATDVMFVNGLPFLALSLVAICCRLLNFCLPVLLLNSVVT